MKIAFDCFQHCSSNLGLHNWTSLISLYLSPKFTSKRCRGSSISDAQVQSSCVATHFPIQSRALVEALSEPTSGSKFLPSRNLAAASFSIKISRLSKMKKEDIIIYHCVRRSDTRKTCYSPSHDCWLRYWHSPNHECRGQLDWDSACQTKHRFWMNLSCTQT